MEQKEEVRVRGDDLQQLVEEAVRKAIGDTLTEEGASHRTPIVEGDYRRDRRVQLEDIPLKETGHTLPWYRGINSIAVNIKLKNWRREKRDSSFCLIRFGGRDDHYLCQCGPGLSQGQCGKCFVAGL
jgi:hypothetical protein